MQDQATTIDEAINRAFDTFAEQHRTTGKTFGSRELIAATLTDLRERGQSVSRWTVSSVLASLVQDGFLLAAASEDLFWQFGNATLSGYPELFDAFDEIEVGAVVDRAFVSDASSEVQ